MSAARVHDLKRVERQARIHYESHRQSFFHFCVLLGIGLGLSAMIAGYLMGTGSLDLVTANLPDSKMSLLPRSVLITLDCWIEGFCACDVVSVFLSYEAYFNES